MPRSEQVWNERYDHGMRVKAVITEVNAEGKGPGIVVSRRNPELIKQLFELEVPEIADAWSRSSAWPASRATGRRSR